MPFPVFKARSHLAILLAIAIFWFALLMISGSLFSGFHFTDDHDIVAIHYHLAEKQMSLMEVITQWLQEDQATGRFRVFYFIHRILQTKLLGIHFLWWSIYTGILAVLTTFFFYQFGRRLDFSIQESLLFSLLTMVGSQSAVWWQLGPAETIATFMLSIALLLIVLSAMPSRFQAVYSGLFVVCTILMSLSKENFILMIPAIGWIKLFWAKQKNEYSWWEAIQKNGLPLLILSAIFCLELLFIKYFVGLTPEIGYAGLSDFTAQGVFNAAISLSNSGAWWIIVVGAILIAFINSYLKPEATLDSKSRTSIPLYFPAILLFLVAVPQIIIYTKSGISQRYLLPGIFAYSFLIVWIYRYIRQRSELFDKVILFLITLSLAFKLHSAWVSAHLFALEGRSTNALLQSVEAHTDRNDPILIVTNTIVYWEWNFSIKKYLNYVSDRNNLYLVSYGQKNETPLSRKVAAFYNYQTLDKLPDKRNARCIVVFPLLNNAFLRNSSDWFVPQEFTASTFNHFNRNLDPNSTIHLYCRNP